LTDSLTTNSQHMEVVSSLKKQKIFEASFSLVLSK
jgi:hypothetical protein